jgi:hypothetical protein
MALSKLEKAMATWIGIEVLKPGTVQPITRKALEAAFVATVRGGQALGRAGLPVAARALPPVARAVANPYVGVPLAAAAGTLALQEYLDESGIQEQMNEAQRQAALQYVGVTEPAIREFATKVKKRPKTEFNKAVSAAMKAVKSSKFQGAKGTLRSPKKTLAVVSKTVSKLAKGGKVATKGVSGVIKRATAKINLKKVGAKAKKRFKRGIIGRYGPRRLA